MLGKVLRGYDALVYNVSDLLLDVQFTGVTVYRHFPCV